MAGYTLVNLKGDVEDQSERFGFSPNLKAHFARVPLELENSGLSYFRIAPSFRLPFGHSHREQEEVYVLLSGSARIKLDDEIVDLKPWDAIRVPGSTMRNIEAGPDGAEMLAFGAPNTDNADIAMTPGWWTD